MEKRFGKRRGRFFEFILAAALVAGCAQVATPETKPTKNETMEPTPLTVCYVFVSEYSEQIGGLPALVANLYVYRDGFLQRTQESSDDKISAVNEVNVEAEDLFEKLDGGEYELPPPVPPPGITPGVLPEFAPPSTLVEYGFCDGNSTSWTGDNDQLPDILHELIDALKSLSEAAVLAPIISGEKYLRAQIVADEKVEEILQTGLPLEITTDDLVNNPILAEALEYPRRLIKTPPDEDAYTNIPLSFSPGKSAFILIDGQLFQIRHLVSNPR